jgi:hypothetical protein
MDKKTAYKFKQYPVLNQKIPDQNLAKLRNKVEFFQNKFLKDYNGDASKIIYKTTPVLTGLAYLYLVQKYKNTCFISNFTMTKEINALNSYFMNLYFTPIGKNRLLNKSAEQIFRCIKNAKDLFVIPISIPGHANLLIYRKKENVIEHFEPHGQYYNLDKFNQLSIDIRYKMNEIIKKINILNKNDHVFDTEITYIPPSDICPSLIGLQTYQSVIEVNNKDINEGLCQMWSIMIAELVLENPNLSTKQIISELLDYGKAVSHKTYPKPYEDTKVAIPGENASIFEKIAYDSHQHSLVENIDKDKTTGISFSNIIFGFTIYLKEQLDDYIKLIFLKYDKNIQTLDDFIIKYSSGNMSTQLKLLMIFTYFMLKNPREMDNLLNEIPNNLNNVEDVEGYKKSLENGIQEATNKINNLMPEYNKLLEELEILRPGFNTSKESYKEKTLRLLNLDDKSNEYRQFKDKYKNLIDLQYKLSSYKFIVYENKILLDTIEEIQIEEPKIKSQTKTVNKIKTTKNNKKSITGKGGKKSLYRKISKKYYKNMNKSKTKSIRKKHTKF